MNSSVIVSVTWLQEHLNDPNVRIIDARVSDPRLPMGYRASHLPNAVPFDLNRDMYEMAPGGPRIRAFDAIAQTLGERGITNDSTLVLYDEGTGPLAGTTYWLLKYMGHDDVRVLNGGWHAWQLAGAPTTKEVPQFSPAPYTARVDENQHSTAEWIQENSARDDVVLLDTRTDSEYYMGHIPNAVNLSFDAAIDFQTQGLRDAQVLRQQFETVGVMSDKEIVVYCGSGSRSAHSYLVLKSLGYSRVRNYKGSMMDWAHRRGLPLE
ncbi:MAG: sulfurtransferase [Chloroflexota bacterium]|nr:MAG: sulfurtransferase [Chloroflexota bacterium]